jgi:hypothetical protein
VSFFSKYFWTSIRQIKDFFSGHMAQGVPAVLRPKEQRFVGPSETVDIGGQVVSGIVPRKQKCIHAPFQSAGCPTGIWGALSLSIFKRV